MKTLRNHEFIILTVILVFLSLTSVANYSEHIKLEQIRACTAQQAALSQSIFAPLASGVQAKAFFVYDFTKKKNLYGVNENTPLPLASLTKLMTIRVALKKSQLSDFHVVTKDDLTSDNFIGFVPGDSYTIRDLVDGALIESLNDAAVMIARSVGLPSDAFIAVMNAEAKNLNLQSLQFSSVTGLDTEANQPTATGSAHDILMLLNKNVTESPDVFAPSVRETEIISATNGRSINLTNTDDAIPKIPLLVASKTGYTVSAGGNLAVLWQSPNGDVLGASVLGSSVTGRFTDMIAIHDAANAYQTAALAASTKICSVY